MAPPVVECVEAVQAKAEPPGHLVMLTPQGRRLTQPIVEELARHPRLLLLCGRYEGFDERIRLILKPDEVSIGDFVLNGGEVAAMVVIDAVIRLIPGVLGDQESSQCDSFSGPERMLEHAQYTRPRSYRGYEVPAVLLSGNHQAINRWRLQERKRRTAERRADLLNNQSRNDSGEPGERNPAPAPGGPLEVRRLVATDNPEVSTSNPGMPEDFEKKREPIDKHFEAGHEQG